MGDKCNSSVDHEEVKECNNFECEESTSWVRRCTLRNTNMESVLTKLAKVHWTKLRCFGGNGSDLSQTDASPTQQKMFVTLRADGIIKLGLSGCFYSRTVLHIGFLRKDEWTYCTMKVKKPNEQEGLIYWRMAWREAVLFATWAKKGSLGETTSDHHDGIFPHYDMTPEAVLACYKIELEKPLVEFRPDIPEEEAWDDIGKAITKAHAGRRRMVCEPAALPTTGEEIAPPSVPTGLWVVAAVLALAFLIYWLVVRRFVRPVRKTRYSQPDLEAQREDLYLRVDSILL